MRIARVRSQMGTVLARIDDDADPVAVPLAVDRGGPGADPLREALAAGVDFSGSGVADSFTFDPNTLLSPVREPQKVIAIGLNYADHARESGAEVPKSPLMFVKTTNSIVGPGDEIVWRASDSSQVDYEAELAVVIGRRAQGISVDDALSYVFGYTCCNDVSARDVQFADGQWVRGKSFDTFCPLGPWIVTADEVPDPQGLGIRCRVDGEALQDSTTAEMIFGVAELVSYLSQFVTLEPGDVIATGTPYGVGFARDPQVYLGDGTKVEVEIDRIGVLANTCRVL